MVACGSMGVCVCVYVGRWTTTKVNPAVENVAVGVFVRPFCRSSNDGEKDEAGEIDRGRLRAGMG
jgi:hypothetical protein